MQTFIPLALVLLTAPPATEAQDAITTGTLLEEMSDLARLARWPEPAYRTVQFSSYDRRSTTSESPGWFSNADGFGREPIPNFAAVLRKPDEKGVGLYLVAHVKGPGAITRGWSAGMGGTWRVYLDGSASPIWEGPAYDFLARRSGHYLKRAGVDLDAGDAFSQQDADYLPIPFARELKVTWEGRVGELHFYHLQVRIYDKGAAVRTFDPERDLRDFEQQLRAAVAALTRPASRPEGETSRLAATLEPQGDWSWSPERQGPGAVTELRIRLRAKELEEALRGVRLRISFDGAGRFQVEAPAGDFFGSGPGVNPYSSLPMSVLPDTTMICRFVMPFSRSVALELQNTTSGEVQLDGAVKISPWTWDDRSLYFRAKWRADHDLVAGGGKRAIDLPYAVAIGKGLFVGAAAMVMNPSGIPTAYGNWWGEGDEKILVDGELSPSTFGTGSEDYFNYSWSRCALFDHPYCGQPLDSGPDTSGYISNHRWQIMDAIPFERTLAVYLELWAHNTTPGLSYSRIAYLYARPGAVDDHRSLMPSDLRVPPLKPREPRAAYGAGGATFHHFEELKPTVSAGKLERQPLNLATRGRIVAWNGAAGERLTVALPIAEEGKYAIHLVAIHRPDGAAIRASLGGKPLVAGDGEETVALRSAHVARNLNVHFKPLALTAGKHELVLECAQPGFVGLDYIWIKKAR
jgi:hypothetical protein